MCKIDIATASEDDIAEALKEDRRVAISGGIPFETSAALAPSAADLVTKLADVAKKNLTVVGHTAHRGDFNDDLQLSRRRAKPMVDALAKDGVALGVGSLSPGCADRYATGCAQNRQVELVLTS